MAEQEKLTEDEAQALEALLTDEGGGEAAAPVAEPAGLLRKKGLIIGLALGLLILVGGGVTAYLFLGGEKEVTEEEPSAGEQETTTETSEDKKSGKENLPNMYAMKPFFLPIMDGENETGQFVHLEINLLLSNSKLSKEVDIVLPLMRQTIYDILKRKRARDFNNPKKPIEDRLKSEIVTSTNSLLHTGSGKIDDVFFTEFVVR